MVRTLRKKWQQVDHRNKQWLFPCVRQVRVKVNGEVSVAKKQDKGINPDLEDAINSMLKDMKINEEWSLTDKMKILDRALKLEAIKLKADSDDWGAGLFDSPDDE